MSSSVVVTCCLPGASTPGKAASSSPHLNAAAATRRNKDHPRIAPRDCVLKSSELATLAAIFHFRNYNPKDGRRGKPISKDEGGQRRSLKWQVTKTKPANFTPRVVEKTDDYVRVEYESPVFGFVDDVEFLFPPGKKSVVQCRSGSIDFNANKKRVKVLRYASPYNLSPCRM